MNEKKLFWLGFYGGIVRIFGILTLCLGAVLAMAASLRGDWTPLILALPPALLLYLFGWALETISELGVKVNELEEQNSKSTPTETLTPKPS